MAKSLTPVEVEIASERIRQLKETFNQRKEQDSKWFFLKLAMGIVAITLLTAVLVFSIYVMIYNKDFPPTVVTSAGAALFVDILGLLASVWKIVLDSNPITKLEPIIGGEE